MKQETRKEMKQDASKEKRASSSSVEEKAIDFRKIAAIIQKNFIVMTRDKIRLVPLLIFPIAMILVLGYTSGTTPKHIPAAIVNYDNSALSQQLQSQIQESNIFAVRHTVSTEGEARTLLDNGDVKVIIEIPPNLEKNVNDGVQAGITVIVDESDSAVAAASRQTLASIVDGVGRSISLQKLVSYQLSVGSASDKVAAFAAGQFNQYGLIAERTSSAESYLKQSQNIIDSTSSAAAASIPAPTVTAPGILTSQGANATVNTNDIVIMSAPGADETQAQVNALQASSGFMTAASQNVHAATLIAQKADLAAKNQQEQGYQEGIAQPLAEIHAFTQSNPGTALAPLVYVEKPAYGTGKRIIDFLIPSIIALTIFQGAVMGMGRAVAGEKRDGSLTRVFLTPTSNLTIVFGTLSFYVLFELFRAAFLILVSMVLFKITIQGSPILIALILAIYIGISIAIGMMLSSLVKTEQQYMAMAMLVSLPTLFLAGAFFPVQAMPKFLQVVAQFLPVTYAGEALRDVMIKGFSLTMIYPPLMILLVFLGLSLGGVFAVFKRDIE